MASVQSARADLGRDLGLILVVRPSFFLPHARPFPASLVGMDRAPDSDMGPQFERRTPIAQITQISQIAQIELTAAHGINLRNL